ncbi:MAG: glycosyltransferase 87 family protein [Microbacterium sp.]|uniref:glycosyltransferase 87 family protein n=1 Tax=Microbacterium sp. TaxID=51671 RepID=UPI002719320F|nr:glycosyltransferase 87 family protein [Microbacterium sp.]MDO8383621.1 glycosyltransferase 87 family protein [Microbacterium sp.]
MSGGLWREWMKHRTVLWVAFAVVHLVVAVLGWVLPNQPMGDVYLVYEPWADAAVDGREIVGITTPFVYPQLALVPMIFARALAWLGGYIIAWSILVTALNAIAFALLIGRARSRARVSAAWFWLAYALLLGPIGMYRIDAVTVPLAVAGLLWLAGRPAVATALLAIGTWMKIWPAALIAAAVVALRRRLTVIASAALVTALVLGVIIVLGGWGHAFDFIGEQTGRGLQLEAPVSTFYLWQAVAGVPGSFAFYDNDILTFQVTGPNVDIVIAVMTPLLAVAVAGVAGLGAYKAWRGASYVRLMPPLALALVLVLIVFNKVGSPQFQTWLIAPLVLWIVLDRTRASTVAALSLVSAALTQVVYPIVYGGVLNTQPVPVALLTARNVITIVLLVITVTALVRVPTRSAAKINARKRDLRRFVSAR